MSAVTPRLVVAALFTGIGLSSAGAVGLGPLTSSGFTNADRKGFYLTLINPYPQQERFKLYSLQWDNEQPDPRVQIPTKEPLLGAKAQRRILVVDTGLSVGEEHKFRVCAERIEPADREVIHARVCSKLTSRRVA